MPLKETPFEAVTQTVPDCMNSNDKRDKLRRDSDRREMREAMAKRR